ncbi:TIGR03757 family integrating conjugative element protein [Burkholderia pseudomallei]
MRLWCTLRSPVSHSACALLFALGLNGLASTAMAADVYVVTDQAHPVRNAANARIIQLDAAAPIEARLSADLSADPQRAAALARQRIAADSIGLQRQLVMAYQGVIDAWDVGVTTIPAVVMDRRYVVYGDPDVAHALARIQAYREAHP